MDFRLVWSPEAIEDVDSIANYISRDSPQYASIVVEKILSLAESISLSPHAGRILPEMGDESIRERIIYSYRLVYRIKGNVVTIAAVVHGKRLFYPIAERISE